MVGKVGTVLVKVFGWHPYLQQGGAQRNAVGIPHQAVECTIEVQLHTYQGYKDQLLPSIIIGHKLKLPSRRRTTAEATSNLQHPPHQSIDNPLFPAIRHPRRSTLPSTVLTYFILYYTILRVFIIRNLATVEL
jgi:hypothetical protein